MKIQMIASISGTRDGADWPAAGELLDVPESEGAQLIAGGLAKLPAKVEKRIETATAPKPETRKGLNKGNTP